MAKGDLYRIAQPEGRAGCATSTALHRPAPTQVNRYKDHQLLDVQWSPRLRFATVHVTVKGEKLSAGSDPYVTGTDGKAATPQYWSLILKVFLKAI
ncbi:hypothetical protein Anapl_03958 [Anas platyrhynchos]|uniref:Uncharacterized protein n=1 Tax=Anas platyrhynchos TaxID=8839 RepID=R0LT71_ANAPL|nr:hypothetical protein Anapl_03958 [Anas platyrhynchos]